MLDVDRINDIPTLKQVIHLQNAELSRCNARIEALTRQVAELKGKDADQAVQQELLQLQAQVNRLQHLMFGDRSERRSRHTGEADAATSAFGSNDGTTIGQEQTGATSPLRADGKPRRKGHGPTPQVNLPLEIREHDLDLPDTMCPSCGGQLTEMTGQFEESEEIDVIERRYVKVIHRRKKYRCKCNACVETALGEQKLIPGGRYSIPFAVHVAVEKFARHDPLTRQVEDMKRQGLVVSDQTLYDLLVAVAHLGAPTVRAILADIKRQRVAYVDETSWKLMKRGKTERWWMLSMGSRNAVYYELSNSRSGETLATLLGDFYGIAVTDGLENYATAQRLQKEKAGRSFELAGCWSHIRRAVLAGEKGYAREANEFLDLIDALFAVDRKADRLARAGPAERSPEQLYQAVLAERARLREIESKPLVNTLHHKVLHTVVHKTSELGKAIGYMHADWKKLTLFLLHPEVELSNNRAERNLRVPVLGRVNYRGNVSEQGARVTSILYTLLHTAKLAGVNPATYLEAVVRHALANPGGILLPWNMTSG